MTHQLDDQEIAAVITVLRAEPDTMLQFNVNSGLYNKQQYDKAVERTEEFLKLLSNYVVGSKFLYAADFDYTPHLVFKPADTHQEDSSPESMVQVWITSDQLFTRNGTRDKHQKVDTYEDIIHLLLHHGYIAKP